HSAGASSAAEISTPLSLASGDADPISHDAITIPGDGSPTAPVAFDLDDFHPRHLDMSQEDLQAFVIAHWSEFEAITAVLGGDSPPAPGDDIDIHPHHFAVALRTLLLQSRHPQVDSVVPEPGSVLLLSALTSIKLMRRRSRQ